MKNKFKISKIATIIIFISTVRIISEPIRQQYYAETSLTVEQIQPYLFAALLTTNGLFVMTILSYYGRHKMIIALAVLILIALVIIKYNFVL
jgi:hypothetical protein